MNRRFASLALCLSLCLPLVPLGFGQTPTETVSALPRLVRFGGTVKDLNGNRQTGVVGITFALYSEQTGGAALWIETQNVNADNNGHYTALLGSTKPDGLPAELFNSEQARWVGVQVSDQAEQPRALLVSAPYALKAGDAETIGGLPPSAFVMASPGTSGSTATSGRVGATKKEVGRLQATDVTTTGGTANYLPVLNGSSTIIDSVVYQSGSGQIGINTTTPGATLDVNGTVNSATSYNLGGKAFAYGSYASINAFLGFAGNSTTTGTKNTALGYEALLSNTTGVGNTANGVFALEKNTTGEFNTASGGYALQYNTTGSDNTATGYATLLENKGNGNTADGYLALQDNSTGGYNTANGRSALVLNTTGGSNTASGAYALAGNTTGAENTAAGYQALVSTTTGGSNTASGYQALHSNTTGGYNVAVGNQSLNQNTTGDFSVGIGFYSGQTADGSAGTGSGNTAVGAGAAFGTGSISNASAIGNNAVVSESNALVLGCIAGVNSCPTTTYVGIATSSPTNLLTLGQGQGPALADGWNTYSSRRWKTNIQTLQGALGKVAQLRGVSYDLKANGKHEVGVIAEEVGAVMPEVVTYEENGKDARGVDYSR
jgi:hypothetical protein